MTAATTAATQLHAGAAAAYSMPPCARSATTSGRCQRRVRNGTYGHWSTTSSGRPVLDRPAARGADDRRWETGSTATCWASDPRAAWAAAYDEAVDAADRVKSEERIVHLSFGDTSGGGVPAPTDGRLPRPLLGSGWSPSALPTGSTRPGRGGRRLVRRLGRQPSRHRRRCRTHCRRLPVTARSSGCSPTSRPRRTAMHDHCCGRTVRCRVRRGTTSTP